MKKIKLIWILCCIVSMISNAQNTNNHWVIGISDVDFSTATPIVNNLTSNNYGRASISDCNGNLLFYTDAGKVWNKNHQVMQNGEINSYLNHEENKQVCVIVPHPGDSNKYYIITSIIQHYLCIECVHNVYYELYIVDFNDPAYPLGKVTYPTNMHKKFHENPGLMGGLTVVKNATNDGYFVVTSNGYTIHSFTITSTGFNPNPIVSTISNNINYDPDNYNGLMQSRTSNIIKFSPDTSTFGQLVITDKLFVGPNTRTSSSHFFKMTFNNSTGTFSNFTTVEQHFVSTGATRDFEFSSDSKKAFLVRGEVFIKDLMNLGNPSRKLFETGTTNIPNFLQKIQRDKNGNILLTNFSNKIHLIENQNVLTNASIKLNWLTLNSYTNYMPQFIDKVCAPSCLQNLVINTPVTVSNDYQVRNQITASSIINNNLTVNYRAKSILLKPGFNVSGNATGKFRAYYDPCFIEDRIHAKETNSENENSNINITENNSNQELNFKIYPNPNNGIFTIQFENSTNNLIEIYTITGQKVFEQQFNNVSVTEIQLNTDSKGIYLVKSTSNGVTKTYKMVIK